MSHISSKPISSPGRPEKFPPPLMRFLKTNSASKSRGKSRASPMFIRNKKNNNVVQEPTSPKVTCIGQVRSKTTAKIKTGSNKPCSCFRIKRIKFHERRKTGFLCTGFGKRSIPRWLKVDWSKWVLFFRPGCCRKSKNLSVPEKIVQDEESIESESGNVEQSEDLGSFCPPKNAFLLTRCRSAPYRSSSQISRFCPVLETEEKTGEKTEEKTEEFENELESWEKEKLNSEKEDLEQVEKKLVDLRLIESILSRKSEEIARNKTRPFVLMRCKSEPAKTGERLNPTEGN